VISASFSNPIAIVAGDIKFIPVEFNLKSYERVFNNPKIITGYLNSIYLTVMGTFLNLVMTICGAYPLSRKDLAGRNIIALFITFTMMFGGGLIPVYLLVRSLGLYNTYWALIIPGIVSAWNMIIMRTFFQSTIPIELQEAALIDGCSNIRLLISIVIPLSTAIIAVMILFYGVAHWNAYFNAIIYLNKPEKYPLSVILREILILSQSMDMMEGNYTEQIMQTEGIKYALIIVASVPVMILYPFLQRYFVKGVMIGAIKG